MAVGQGVVELLIEGEMLSMFEAAAVIVELVGNAADECEFIGDLGVHRQKFADVDSRHVGRNRRKLPAVILRRTFPCAEAHPPAKQI